MFFVEHHPQAKHRQKKEERANGVGREEGGERKRNKSVNSLRDNTAVTHSV